METNDAILVMKYFKEYKKCENCFEQKKIINKARKMLSTENFIIFLGDCIDFVQEIRNRTIVNTIVENNNKRNLLLNKN